MIKVIFDGVADDADLQQLRKCLEWIGYKVISISGDFQDDEK